MTDHSSSTAKNLKRSNYIDQQVDVVPQKNQILVVEDDPFSQKLFSHIINDLFKDHQICIAVDYKQARKFLISPKNLKFAIIDIFLDGPRSGIDLLNYLRTAEISLPIIMTSNLPQNIFYDLVGEKNKPPIYLRKPFQPDLCRYVLEDLKFEEN